MNMNRRNRPSEFESAKVTTRRGFIGTSFAAAASAAMSRARAGDGKAGMADAPASFSPAGELQERIRMTRDRLTGDGEPSFSDRFVLADVALDPVYPRRFTNYSGDLSGRYVGALSLLPPVEGTSRHLRFEYVHGGWTQRLPLVLRPISEQTAGEPHIVAVWFRVRHG